MDGLVLSTFKDCILSHMRIF